MFDNAVAMGLNADDMIHERITTRGSLNTINKFNASRAATLKKRRFHQFQKVAKSESPGSLGSPSRSPSPDRHVTIKSVTGTCMTLTT